MGSSSINSQTSVLTSAVNIMSSLKTTVVDSAGTVGSAMGFKTSKRGILGNPNIFLGNQGSSLAVNYNPPTSMSSESFHQTSL